MKYFLLLFVTLNVNNVVFSEDKPRFSIGLGVLAPSYSQKFAGNGRLDVDQDKNGFSYTLNNVPHGSSGSTSSYQSQSYGSAPQQSSGSEYAAPQAPGHFSIYQHRSVPKSPASPGFFASSSDDDYHPAERNSHSSNSNGQYDHNSDVAHEYQQPSPALGSLSGGHDNSGRWSPSANESPDYSNEGQYNPNEGQSGANEQQQGGQPHFGAYNFEQQISHQIQEAQPFQNHASAGQGYPPEPSHQPTYESHPSSPYQSQPSHQRVIRLQSQPMQRPQMIYRRP